MAAQGLRPGCRTPPRRRGAPATASRPRAASAMRPSAGTRLLTLVGAGRLRPLRLDHEHPGCGLRQPVQADIIGTVGGRRAYRRHLVLRCPGQGQRRGAELDERRGDFDRRDRDGSGGVMLGRTNTTYYAGLIGALPGNSETARTTPTATARRLHNQRDDFVREPMGTTSNATAQEFRGTMPTAGAYNRLARFYLPAFASNTCVGPNTVDGRVDQHRGSLIQRNGLLPGLAGRLRPDRSPPGTGTVSRNFDGAGRRDRGDRSVSSR